MSRLFYGEDRDKDFYNACEQARKIFPHASTYKIIRLAVMSPAPSFYLHPRQYISIINNKNIRKFPVSKVRQELHLEIIRRYRGLAAPDKTQSETVSLIAAQPAPRFYISEKRVLGLYYKLMKRKN
jgi:hypothetical protein